MKIKLKDLNPNPFKKDIDGGKLNKEQVEIIKSSIKELGLMGTLPVVKIKDKYHLVSHHHRHQAMKEFYGKDYEVNVTIQNYSEDQLLRGMIMENLTQRTDDFKEIVQNLKCVRGWLKSEGSAKKWKEFHSDSERNSKRGRINEGRPDEAGSISHISEWLNKQGEIMSRGSISEHLSVADNLSEELYNKIEKTHSGDASKRTDGKTIAKSQAIMLSRIKDKKEQKEIAVALHSSRENRVRDQSKILTEYKKAKPEVKEAVRKGEMDIADVEFETHKDNFNTPNLFKEKLNLTKHIELRTALGNAFEEKLFLKKSPTSELEATYHYIISWIKEDLIPFMKEIEIELKKKGEEKGMVYYEFNERGKI